MLQVLYSNLTHQSHHFTKVLTLGYELHRESNILSEYPLSQLSSTFGVISTGKDHPSLSSLFVSLSSSLFKYSNNHSQTDQ